MTLQRLVGLNVGSVEPDKYNPAMRHPLWVAAAVISVYALALATKALQSPEEKLMSRDQKVIDGCWHESRGTTLTPSQQQVVIGACQKLEEVYRHNWGTDPGPASTVL